jgi:gamma-glutamyltranspeptidase
MSMTFAKLLLLLFISHIYLDEKGNAIKSKSRNGPFAVGVPGLIRGLFYVHNKFGKLKWSQLFSPAIKAAREGIKVYPICKWPCESDLKP